MVLYSVGCILEPGTVRRALQEANAAGEDKACPDSRVATGDSDRKAYKRGGKSHAGLAIAGLTGGDLAKTASQQCAKASAMPEG